MEKIKLEFNETNTLGRFLYLKNSYLHRKEMAYEHGYPDLVKEYCIAANFYDKTLEVLLDEIINKYRLINVDKSSISINVEEMEMTYNETK